MPGEHRTDAETREGRDDPANRNLRKTKKENEIENQRRNRASGLSQQGTLSWSHKF